MRCLMSVMFTFVLFWMSVTPAPIQAQVLPGRTDDLETVRPDVLKKFAEVYEDARSPEIMVIVTSSDPGARGQEVARRLAAEVSGWFTRARATIVNVDARQMVDAQQMVDLKATPREIDAFLKKSGIQAEAVLRMWIDRASPRDRGEEQPDFVAVTKFINCVGEDEYFSKSIDLFESNSNERIRVSAARTAEHAMRGFIDLADKAPSYKLYLSGADRKLVNTIIGEICSFKGVRAKAVKDYSTGGDAPEAVVKIPYEGNFRRLSEFLTQDLWQTLKLSAEADAVRGNRFVITVKNGLAANPRPGAANVQLVQQPVRMPSIAVIVRWKDAVICGQPIPGQAAIRVRDGDEIPNSLYESLRTSLNQCGFRTLALELGSGVSNSIEQALRNNNEKEALRLMGPQQGLVCLVNLFKDPDPGITASGSVALVDLRQIQPVEIARLGPEQFRDPVQLKELRGRADRWSQALSNAFANQAARPREYNVVVIAPALGELNDAIRCLKDASVQVLDPAFTTATDDLGRHAKAQFVILERSDPIEVASLLDQTFRCKLGLATDLQHCDNQGIVMRVGQSVAVPMWAKLLEPATYPAEAGRLKRALADQGNPAIGLVLFTRDAQGNLVLDTANSRLAGALQESLTGAGLSLVDSSIDRQIRAEMSRNQALFRGGDNAQLQVIAALRQLPAVKLAIIGIARTGGGGAEYEFKLVDVQNSAFIAFQAFPDARAQANRRYTVQASDPSSVARFIAGSLLEGISRLEGKPQTLNVFVKGAGSLGEVLAVAQLLKEDPSVVACDNVNFAFGAGSFRIQYVDQFQLIAGRLTRKADALPFQPVFDVATGGMLELQMKSQRPAQWGFYPPREERAELPPQSPARSARQEKPQAAPPQGFVVVPSDNGRRLALVIGCGDYPTANKLKCSAADAKLMAQTLVEHCGFDARSVFLLADGATPGTRKNIEAMVDALAKEAQPNDTILVYFSGHGSRTQGASPRAFLVGIDEQPVFIDELRTKLRSSRASRRVLLLDSCHSGTAMDNSCMELIGAGSEGIVTIAGCRANQFSLECPKLGNSLFTFFLARGLAGEAAVLDASGKLKVVEVDYLYHYLYGRVRAAAWEIYKEKQEPFILQAKTGQIILSVAPGQTAMQAAAPPQAVGAGQ